MKIRILDIGQCGFDGPRLEELWNEELGARATRAGDAAEAGQHLHRDTFDVILVNRLLASDGTPGIDVIDQLLADSVKTPVMLVSDRADAREEAVARGAVRHFGKADLGEPETVELIRKAARGEGIVK